MNGNCKRSIKGKKFSFKKSIMEGFLIRERARCSFQAIFFFLSYFFLAKKTMGKFSIKKDARKFYQRYIAGNKKINMKKIAVKKIEKRSHQRKGARGERCITGNFFLFKFFSLKMI